MKKYLFILTLVFSHLFSWTQTVNNPNIEFKYLQHFTFEHLNDHYITLEYINRDKQKILDTVYSCNYDNNNRITEERYCKYEKYLNFRDRTDGTTVYSYDSIGRISNVITYMQPNYQSKYELNEVHISLYQYNSFDSISFIENYHGSRNRLPNAQETQGSVVSLTIGEYTEDWNWHYTGGVKYEYDSLNNKLIRQYSVIPDNFNFGVNSVNISEFIHTFKYDSLNRITNESHTTHSMNGYPVDSNSVWNYELIYKYHHDSLIITNNKSSYPYLETTIKYNSKGNVINKVKKVSNNDGGEWQIINKFYYDNIDRVIKQIEIYNNSSNSTEFNYYYNKKGG
ncbi:MAG TPA: hypothetical protein VIN73_11215 [Vicingaceae bacterium]